MRGCTEGIRALRSTSTVQQGVYIYRIPKVLPMIKKMNEEEPSLIIWKEFVCGERNVVLSPSVMCQLSFLGIAMSLVATPAMVSFVEGIQKLTTYWGSQFS